MCDWLESHVVWCCDESKRRLICPKGERPVPQDGQSTKRESGFQRVWLQQILDFKAWDPQVLGELARNLDSEILSLQTPGVR